MFGDRTSLARRGVGVALLAASWLGLPIGWSAQADDSRAESLDLTPSVGEQRVIPIYFVELSTTADTRVFEEPTWPKFARKTR